MSQSKKATAASFEPGDVFTYPLRGGWYGALRILRRDETGEHKPFYYLVATTPYLEHEPANIEDPRLKHIHIRNYFAWQNNPAVVWLTKMPPGNLEFVGNLPLTADELTIDSSMFGDWSHTESSEALWQWRWEHDREALVAEYKAKTEMVQALYNASKKNKQKPKKMLPEGEFWALIALLQQPTDDREVSQAGLERLIAELATRTKTTIKQFQETLTYKLYLLDTKAHADACGGSDDGFLYTRCYVVASGPESYASVLSDPSECLPDLEFEDLLAVAELAYERKTGEEFDYETGCSYETGSNLKGWPES